MPYSLVDKYQRFVGTAASFFKVTNYLPSHYTCSVQLFLLIYCTGLHFPVVYQDFEINSFHLWLHFPQIILQFHKHKVVINFMDISIVSL